MVKFIKSFRQYGPGEVAKFSKQHEAWLIEKRIAEKFIPPAKEDNMAKGTDKDNKQPQTPPQQQDPGAPKDKQTTVGPQSRR